MSHSRFLVGLWLGAAATSLGLALWSTVRLNAHRADTLLGHYRYEVADPRRLLPVDPKGEVQLMPKAAHAYRRMQQEAKAEGITLVPVSGYRTLERQRRLFFEGAAEQAESVTARAMTCAPPGYSEHHTGYSLDIGDGAHVDTQLELKFKDTRAFHWLRANAPRFNFEMSFPKGNRQHVSYEPWHWRFVGDPLSFRTFYYARLGDQP